MNLGDCKMPKANVLSIEGKKLKEISLPEAFGKKIRTDIVSKVLESKKSMQPYGPSPLAGKQHVVNKIVHRRKVWRSGYGRGMSRLPRKIMLRRGSQFNWEGAEVPFAKGGRRAHPPKPISHINDLKVNKKELSAAFESALGATAKESHVSKKYKTLKTESLKGKLPFVVDSKISSLKTKKLLDALEKILGKEVFKTAIKKKRLRSGKGKMRGRKQKKSAGALIVLGKSEKLKTSAIEVKNVQNLSVLDLAKGGTGRIVIYTENALKDISGLSKEGKE